ncbi:hypothetical protein [Thalassotalea fusca]
MNFRLGYFVVSTIRSSGEYSAKHSLMFTLVLCKKKLKAGMPSTDVVVALGSPNILKTAPNGNEVWVYDKFSTEQVYQSAGGALGYFAGNGGGIVTETRGSSQVSSNTLTAIIKFDENSNVDTIAYHRSKF